MANQSQTDATLNPRQSTMQVIATRIKVLRLLSVAVMALFVLIGTVHADIFVSNYYSGTVGKYYDDGTVNSLNFLLGASTAEGVQCVKLTSNEVYVANANSNVISVYSLTGGPAVSSFRIFGAIRFVALAMDAQADVLYAADDQSLHIWAVNLPIGLSGAPCTPVSPCSVSTNWSHDVVVGPSGNVYASNRVISGLGVKQFTPVPTHPLGRWNPGSGTIVIPSPSSGYGGHSFANAGSMIFDGAGNLWVNNVNYGSDSTDAIFEFAPLYPGSSTFGYLNFTGDPGAVPLGMDISPTNPPAPPFDPCKGCIVVAEFLGKPGYPTGDVDQVDATTCTGTLAVPGTCQFYRTPEFTGPFITATDGPKYVRFIENCNDTGYVEICKMSCLTNPVTGYFTFEATNSGFDSGPLSIPVNACSGPIQIPNGTVTIHETQQVGIEVSDITAYDYDYQGYQISALLSFNLPFQTGNVDVVSGDVSTETVAGFTNCASGPGELKICKIAGPGVMVGTLFSFTASGDPTRYHVQAGPAPGGYCVVGMSYPVGTPVLVTELPQTGYKVSNITVAPADRGGMQTSNSTIAIIDSGTTEVTFTNIPSGGAACVGACGVR